MRSGVHPTAVIGEPPQWRDWKDGDPSYPPEIDPTARINALCVVDSGVEYPTRIGARSYLMSQVHVGHDCVIEEDCELAPGVVLCGFVTLRKGARLGVNVSVKPLMTIGAGARVGAGAVVCRDIPAGQVWVGNPARPITHVARVGDDGSGGDEERDSGYEMNGTPLTVGEARRLGALR